MAEGARTRAELVAEVESLLARLAEAEAALGGWPEGEVVAAGRGRVELQASRLADSILDCVAGAVVACDRDLRITRCSQEAERLCGRDPLGEEFEAVFPLSFDSDLCTDVRGFMAQALGGRRLQGVDASMVDSRGTVVNLLLNAGPLRGAEQEVEGCIVTLTDITGRKRAQEAIEQAKEEAEAANRSKDAFLANLSHELRTPLSPVLMSISELDARADLPAEVAEQITMIRRNVEMAAKLMDDLLDLTRIERGKLELNFQVVDACVLLKQAAGVCSADAAAKNLRLTVDVQAGQYYLRADPDRLQQAFWNLIKNAVKFTPAGGKIDVRCCSASEGKVAVEVSDTGIGIDPQTLPRLFVPFEQGGREMTRRFGGLGLGLAISRMLVELHGGTLRAQSEGWGMGATFTVELSAEAQPQQSEAAPMAIEAGEQDHLRILLVEDHVDTARIMKHLLESFGHYVRKAEGVISALEVAREEEFDLVVGDLGLPDGNGLELMRELGRRYGLKGIAVSGYGMQEDVEKSREAGFLEHIVKPINMRKLEELIRSITQRVLRSGRASEEGAKRDGGRESGV